MKKRVISETGIYRREIETATTQKEQIALVRRLAENMDLDRVLSRLQKAALLILARHKSPPAPTKHKWPKRADTWPHRLPDDAPEIARDAKDVMIKLRILRDHIAAGDLPMAALFGIRLGTCAGRMGVRWAEPHVARGRKTLRAAKAGHAATHGDRQQKNERWARYQDLLDGYLKRNPDASYNAACTYVSAKEGRSARTIQRHTHR